jgi:hypothetical protein
MDIKPGSSLFKFGVAVAGVRTGAFNFYDLCWAHNPLPGHQSGEEYEDPALIYPVRIGTLQMIGRDGELDLSELTFDEKMEIARSQKLQSTLDLQNGSILLAGFTMIVITVAFVGCVMWVVKLRAMNLRTSSGRQRTPATSYFRDPYAY